MLTYPAHVLNELAFDAVIKKGNKGLKVRRVQEWLSIHDCPTPVDGDFGDATEKCVKDFQQSKGMPTTGKVNKETWDALTAPLSDALKPVEVPEGSSLAEVNLRVVRQHLAQHPVEIGGENRGPWVRVYMGGNQGKEWRWCAGFVTFVMKQACMLLNRATPITGSYSCDSLAYQAKEAGLFVKGTDLASGGVSWSELGVAQVFLLRATPTDWIHTGLSFEGSGSVFSTIEGNTNDDGSSNGYEVCARTRSLRKKDFIRFPT
jgi:hypothetical protein